MFDSCFLKLFFILENKEKMENTFGSQFCFVLKNKNMLVFSKNCSYGPNLVFYVFFVISRTKKKKKTWGMFGSCFLKLSSILKNKGKMKNTFGSQFCFVLKNKNMFVFSKNCSYGLNLVFYVFFVISRTQKET